MRTCPACRSTEVRISHRRGILERGLLAGVGIFPFRCEQCQTRFYRLAVGAYRRRSSIAASSLGTFAVRPARWPIALAAEVAVQKEGRVDQTPIRGVAENVSLEGVRVRLPVSLQPGRQVSVRLEGESLRSGDVRWSRVAGESGVSHGVRYHAPLGHRARLLAKPFRRLRRQQGLRRFWGWMGGLLLIAAAAYGLVWLLGLMWAYNPSFYEPKDRERQQQYQELSHPGVLQ